MTFEEMSPLQRRLHNAALVIEAEGDDHGFAKLQRDAIEALQPNTQEPVAWADDAAFHGRVGNVCSTAAKRYWERSDWVDRKNAELHVHPLYPHPAPQQEPLTNDELWTVWDDYYSDTASYYRQSFDVAFLRAVLAAAHGVKP